MKKKKYIIIFLIIYIISPIDLLPEWFLGPLGTLDDAGALLYIIKLLIEINNNKKNVTIDD